MMPSVLNNLQKGLQKYAAAETTATPAPVAPPKPAATGLPDPIKPVTAPIAPTSVLPPPPAVTLPADRGQPAREPAFQNRPTPLEPQTPAAGPASPAAANVPGAGPTGSGLLQPSLTSPEATQPNPQGGPSTAQKPPSGPTQVLNTEEVQAAPGEAPLGHVSANEADEAFFANPDLYHRDEAAAVREYRANKQQPPKTELQTQPNPQGGPSTAQKPPAPAPAPAQAQAQPQPAAAVGTPVSTPVSTSVGTADKAFSPELMTKMQNAQTPEQKQAVQQEVTGTLKQHVDQNPLYRQGLADMQAGRTDTEGAKALQTNMDKYKSTMVYDEFEKLKQADPTANLSDPGTYAGFISQASNTAMTKFNEMPIEHQMLTGLGLGGGLIGILSSLFGGGGMTGGLLGMLGLAAGGMAGAAGGMFGDQAQATTGKMMGDFGNFIGMIPNEARDASNFNEAAAKKTKDSIAKAMREAPMGHKAAPGQGAQIGQQMLTAERAKFDPLRSLHKTSPQAAYSMLMGMKNGPQTAADAAKLYEQLNTQYDATGQEGYLYSQTLDNIRQRQQNPEPLDDRLMSFLKPEDILEGMGFQIPAAQTQKGASMNIAQQIFFKQAALKAARCWAGYEPVPGKAPYSDNSCQPKRKKKKVEKKAEQYSNEPFNPAIGYPPPSAKSTPMDHYKNQMYLSGQEVAKKTKNPKYQYSNNYNMATRHYGGLPPRPPVDPVSPGQMAAPVTPAQPAVKLPVNPGPRNTAPAFQRRIKPPAATTLTNMGPGLSTTR